MKVELKPTIARKNLKSLRKIKAKSAAKLKQAAKDTFANTSTEQSGKRILVSRKYPNWCDGEDTQYVNRTFAKTVCYYPEDEKLMEKMNDEELISFKRFLRKVGRYYEVESTQTRKEFEEFVRSLGLDPEKYYIRDNA